MGAGHSTPQTARIDNPQRIIVPIQITPSVVRRLEEAQRVQQEEYEEGENEEKGNEENEYAEKEYEERDYKEKGTKENEHIEREYDEKLYEQKLYEGKEKSQKNDQSNREDMFNYPTIENIISPDVPFVEIPQPLHDIENTFTSTIEKLETYIDQTVAWKKKDNCELTRLREEVIDCYKDHPGEPLFCAYEAKKFREFIYREQHRCLKESNLINDFKEAASTFPHQHHPDFK